MKIAKVAVLGGSFNPPHLGHMFICQYILATGRADQVWLMPVYKHAFGKKLLGYSDRKAMCNAIAGEFHFHSVITCDIEEHTLVGGVNRTLITIMALNREYPNYKFSLIMGSDILNESYQWLEFEKIKKFADIIIIGRDGYPCEEETVWIPDISSTDIRERIAAGKPIDHLVHRSVLGYVNQLKNLGE